MNTLGTRLKQARDALGLTQQQVADAAGVSQGTIGNLESGARKSARELLAIARAVKRTPEWLTTGKDPINQPSSRGASSDSTPYTVNLYSATNLDRAPVVEWARLGIDLYKGNDETGHGETAPFETAKPHGARCKFIRVQDDSLAPRVLSGDRLLIDPDDKHPKSDQIVLFELLDGTFRLMRYRAVVNGFEAYDNHGRTYESSRHGIKVAGTYVLLLREDES